MGRFVDRFRKHPENGTERYINQARSYCCSLTLGRDFGESIEDFMARSPAVSAGITECHNDIADLTTIAITEGI